MDKHNFETIIITDESLFQRLMNYETNVDSNLMVLDVETNSEQEILAELYGIGVCFTDQKAFYIPWRKQDGTKWWSPQSEQKIVDWLEATTKKRLLIGHNIIYDVLVIENNLQIDLTEYIYSDSILQKHTLDEEPPFALKEISVIELGEWADKAQEALKENVLKNGGRFNATAKDMYLADTNVLAEYCCWDVMLTLLMFFKYEQKLKDEGLYSFFYEEEVMPLYKHVTIQMKRRGFPVDMAHFQGLKRDLETEILRLEDEIIQEIKPDIAKFEMDLLDRDAPIKTTGNFPKILAELLGVPLPITKDGKVTLAKKAIEKQKEAAVPFAKFYDWMLGNESIDKAIPSGMAQMLYSSLDSEIDDPVMEARKRMYFGKDGGRHIFNLRSNDHLKVWLVDIKGHKPIETTETGKAKVDDDFLWFIREVEPAAYKLMDFKQLNKLLSTYVEGILERQINGTIYTSMLQFGTTSGRFSSRNPNLQNLPKPVDPKEAADAGISLLVLKYLNNIRKGFIAGPGKKLVDADYNALEPRCFAHMSGDETLRNVFRKGEDLYSRVAIDTLAIPGVSAFKKDPNYLGTVNKTKRGVAKVFCLAVPYGAEEARIAEELGISFDEARDLIASYLNAYPNLKRYMAQCNKEAKTDGFVKTEFGRVRHLKRAKELHDMYGDKLLDYKWAKRQEQSTGIAYTKLRREYKNALNNSKNFKIQGLAAHIVNRSMIALAKAIKSEGLDAYIALQVHDQVIAISSEAHAPRVKDLMKQCLENTITISLPLPAEPAIADNMADSH